MPCFSHRLTCTFSYCIEIFCPKWFIAWTISHSFNGFCGSTSHCHVELMMVCPQRWEPQWLCGNEELASLPWSNSSKDIQKGSSNCVKEIVERKILKEMEQNSGVLSWELGTLSGTLEGVIHSLWIRIFTQIDRMLPWLYQHVLFCLRTSPNFLTWLTFVHDCLIPLIRVCAPYKWTYS